MQTSNPVERSPSAPASSPSSFFDRPFVQEVLPFVTSLALHLGLIALGVLTYHAVTRVTERSVPPAVIPTAATTIMDNSDSPLTQFPGLADDDTRKATQHDDLTAPDDATGLSSKPSVTLSLNSAGGEKGEQLDEAIALGLNQSFARSKTSGIGTADGPGSGTGDGDGPGLAPIGPGSGGSKVFDRPKGPGVTRVAYLCDASGSMTTKFDTLRTELRKAIDSLRPIQQFDAIFFLGNSAVALDPQLLFATPDAKRRAYDFLDTVTPHDSSNPIPGLRAAFATHPELIYILTDGDFPDNQALLQELRKLNSDHKVRINTIAFMDKGEDYEKLLKQIAQENGGLFKFVSDEDLKK